MDHLVGPGFIEYSEPLLPIAAGLLQEGVIPHLLLETEVVRFCQFVLLI